MSLLFCNKYKPKTTKDIIGNNYSVFELCRLLRDFNKCKRKCILVTGTHGSGKSCCVEVVLNKLKYASKVLNITKFKQQNRKTEKSKKSKNAVSTDARM